MDGKKREYMQPSGTNEMTEQGTTVEPENALPEVSLTELPQKLQQGADRAQWARLMPVQAKTIPYILKRRDLMVQSRTGSGKTGAFILPMLERIDPSAHGCRALVLVPTRELARQVQREAEMLIGPEGIRTVAVYGGVGYGPQIEAFRQGAQLVVGTPGRVLDHLLKRNLSLDKLEILVLDEADRMLSMGFYPDMKEIQSFLPRRQKNAYLFSATFPTHVMHLAAEFLNRPEMLSLSHDRVHVVETEHLYYVVPPMEKDRCLVRILEVENPFAAFIFCNTRAKVHYLNTVLKRFGFNVDELSSDLGQAARDKVMNRVREGTLRFLVSTDVAARGIDIPELSHVFQFEPPEDPEAYIHRAGRTGRAGAGGVAVTLVSSVEESELLKIARRFQIDFQQRELPGEQEVAAAVAERATALLEARFRERGGIEKERSDRFVPLARSLAANEEELALIAMLLDDFYQGTLQAPLVPFSPSKVDSGSANRGSGRKPRRSGTERKDRRSGGRRPDRRRR